MQKKGRFAFLAPPPHLRGLGATYDVYLRFFEKRVMDFLLVLVEHFSLGVTAQAIRANNSESRRFASTGSVWPKFQVQGVVSHKRYFVSEN